MTFQLASLSSLVHFALHLLCFLLMLRMASELGLPLTALKTRAFLVMGCLFSLMLLSGCGTAPLQVQTSPPVPAGLLTPPRPPVLLQVPSRSTTPGATTPSTPSSAPKTGSTTSA